MRITYGILRKVRREEFVTDRDELRGRRFAASFLYYSCRDAENRTRSFPPTEPRQSLGLPDYVFLSGRRESNPVFTHPKRTYYRYTTARSWRIVADLMVNALVVTDISVFCGHAYFPAGKLRDPGSASSGLRLAQSALRSIVHLSGFEPETFRM